MNEWLPRWSKPGSMRQAALVGGILAALQESAVNDAEIYDAKCQAPSQYAPLFDASTCGPRKAYWAFAAFNELRKLGTSVRSSSSSPDVAVTAAVGPDGKSGAILIANVGKDAEVKLELGGRKIVKCRVIDGMHDLAEATLPAVIPADTVWLLEVR